MSSAGGTFVERGLARKVLPSVTARMIIERGFAFQSAMARATLATLARGTVVDRNLDGLKDDYDEMVAKNPTLEVEWLKAMEGCLGKTAQNHHVRVRQILEMLFQKTTDPKINYVKSTTFGIEGGEPIAHPTVAKLLATPHPSGA